MKYREIEMPVDIDLSNDEHRRILDAFLRAALPRNLAFALVATDNHKMICSENMVNFSAVKTLLRMAIENLERDESEHFDYGNEKGTLH